MVLVLYFNFSRDMSFGRTFHFQDMNDVGDDFDDVDDNNVDFCSCM